MRQRNGRTYLISERPSYDSMATGGGYKIRRIRAFQTLTKDSHPMALQAACQRHLHRSDTAGHKGRTLRSRPWPRRGYLSDCRIVLAPATRRSPRHQHSSTGWCGSGIASLRTGQDTFTLVATIRLRAGRFDLVTAGHEGCALAEFAAPVLAKM